MDSPHETRPMTQDSSEEVVRELERHTSAGVSAHDAHAIDPWRIHVWMERYPKGSFTLALGCFILFIMITIVTASQGVLIKFSTDVPFYLRDNPAKTNDDALAQGKKDATWKRPDGQATTRAQQVVSDTDLRLMFVRNDGGNILEEKYLRVIEEIENKILNTNGFSDYCLREYGQNGTWNCRRQRSITHLFDPKFFVGATNTSYDLIATERNFYEYFLPSTFYQTKITGMNYSVANVQKISKYWAEYNRGTKLNGSNSAGIWNNKTMPVQFKWRNPFDGKTAALANMMILLADSEWGVLPSSVKARAVMTIFEFGLPLKSKGYNSESQNTIAQNDLIGRWCYDNFQTPNAVFEDYNLKFSNWNMRWECGSMAADYINEILLRDATFLVVTFVFVWLFMTYMTGSFWLSTWGMVMIFMNFGPALLLYSFITQFKYFGTLNIMGMFIILAIGADDVFVIVDTWSQIRTKSPDFPLSKRLTMTIKHAGKVMLTTSISTMASFASNATSKFPGVQTFGIFSAWLIMVNYCAVVTFYPTVLLLHDLYFYTYDLKYGWCCNKACESKRVPACCFDGNKGRCVCLKSEVDKTKELEARPIDQWFEDWFFVKIYNNRKKCLAFFGALFLVFFYFATQLKPDPNAPQMLPDNNNYQAYGKEVKKYFSRTENWDQITANIYFGINGIDRTGVDYTIPEDLGKVKWDPSFSILSANEHEWMAQFCDDLLCGHDPNVECRFSIWDKLKVTKPQKNVLSPVQCPISAFRDWLLYNPNAIGFTLDQWLSLNQFNNLTQSLFPFNVSYIRSVNSCQNYSRQWPIADPECFAYLSTVWSYDDIPTSNPKYVPGYNNYNYWKPHIFISKDKKNPMHGTLRFVVVTVKINSYINSDFNDGMKLYDHWGTYIKKWVNHDNGLVSYDQFNRLFVTTPAAMKSARHSSHIFSYYFVEDQITREAINGIVISLACALVIITVATNNWMMALLSTFTITVIVICVIGFTVMMGWNLGVIEAVIYVMVVGMSVDYVVHLSEAYLTAGEQGFHTRDERSKGMLGIVGASVLSGAISTGGGIFFLLFAIIRVFSKFASTILFLVVISCLYALFAFTATMTLIGPQGRFGNFWNLLQATFYGLRWCCCKKPIPPDFYNAHRSGGNDLPVDSADGGDGHQTHVEMRYV